MGKAAAPKPKVLIIGGQFSGNFSASCLKKHFDVTVVDAKEYFEYTPGVLRAYVKPCHLDALTFMLEPVFSRRMKVKFVLGEVLALNAKDKCAKVKPMTLSGDVTETYAFDYCVICSGCNFGPFDTPGDKGESLWFPVVHAVGREVSAWKHIDERFLEGRRRHILEEYHTIATLAKNKATILVVGAGFIGVEWVTELQYFFPALKLIIIDFLPNCLGPLPQKAANYCAMYMADVGIQTNFGTGYAPDDETFWKKLALKDGKTRPDKMYDCRGVLASNYFMPDEVLSTGGPGTKISGKDADGNPIFARKGKWICMNKHLQVVTEKDDAVWGDGTIYAVGDCNAGALGKPPNWEMPPVPKISYPGEEQAMHAVKNIEAMAKAKARGATPKLMKTWWPWGAGMFATSLGPHDACFVLAANDKKGSGYMVNWWYPAALQKEIIESTKINECKHIIIGRLIWHFVHHTPINLWGKGPCFP